MIKERKRAMCQNSNRTPRLLLMSYDLFHSINAFISIRNTLTSVVLNVKLTNNLNILARQVSCGGYILCVPILLVGTIDYPRVYYRGRVRYVAILEPTSHVYTYILLNTYGTDCIFPLLVTFCRRRLRPPN